MKTLAYLFIGVINPLSFANSIITADGPLTPLDIALYTLLAIWHLAGFYIAIHLIEKEEEKVRWIPHYFFISAGIQLLVIYMGHRLSGALLFCSYITFAFYFANSLKKTQKGKTA